MAFENLTRYLCDPGPPPESKIWGVEMDYSLWEILEDNVEVGETALLSHHEIAFYLKIHEDEGLKMLEQLARLQLPDSCHPRIPLLAPDVHSAILQLSKKAQSGEVLN